MPEIRVILSRTLFAVVVVLTLTTTVGAMLGSPMGVSYVETNSMQPTLAPGDGFILVPTAVTSPPETGDVIVFRSEELGGGQLTTHRVVGETTRGYITQGDNNNSPDQASGEPPVQRAQLVGQPLYIGNQIVVLPQIGSAITITEDIINIAHRWVNTLLVWTEIRSLSSTHFGFGVTGLFAVLYLVETVRGHGRASKTSTQKRHRETQRHGHQYSTHTILLALTGLLVLATTAPMLLPSGPTQHGAIASKSNGPAFVSPGEQYEFTHTIGNTPLLPMVVIVEAGDSVTVPRKTVSLQRGDVVNISATMSVPSSVGYHRFYVIEHWYIPVLPRSILTALFQIHPWLPIAVIDLVIAIPYYLLGRYTLLRSPAYSRSRSRSHDNSP